MVLSNADFRFEQIGFTCSNAERKVSGRRRLVRFERCIGIFLGMISCLFLLKSALLGQWSTDPNNNLIVGYGLNTDLCGDNAGGAYVTCEYPTTFPRTTLLRRLDRYGYQPWGIARSIVGERAQTASASIVADGQGGVLISYVDSDVLWPQGLLISRVRVQRVDSTGNLLWGSSGVRVSTSEHAQNTNSVHGIASDAQGGCIVVWVDTLNELRAQRVDAGGTRAWGDSGLHVAGNAHGPIWARQDGAGGIFVSWLAQGPTAWKIQRVSGAARLVWDSSGVVLPFSIDRLQEDGRANVVVSGFTGSSQNVRYVAQKVDSLGVYQWPLPYVVLGDSTASEPTGYPLSVDFQASHTMFGWSKMIGPGQDLYAQILRSDGSTLFPDGGRPVGLPYSQKSAVGTLPSDSGTTIYAWFDQRPVNGIYAQRVDTLGRSLWDTSDALLSTLSLGGPKIISDAYGGCILVGWRETDLTIRAQQISRAGILGQIVADVDGWMPRTVVSQFQLYQNYPNPFNPTTSIRFDLPKCSHVKLSVYDLLGREVRVCLDEDVPSGTHEVIFDGRGLASGSYLYAIQSSSGSTSHKLLIIK